MVADVRGADDLRVSGVDKRARRRYKKEWAMAPGVNKLELARMVHVWRVWRDDDDWRGWLVARDDVGATSTTRLARDYKNLNKPLAEVRFTSSRMRSARGSDGEERIQANTLLNYPLTPPRRDAEHLRRAVVAGDERHGVDHGCCRQLVNVNIVNWRS